MFRAIQKMIFLASSYQATQLIELDSVSQDSLYTPSPVIFLALEICFYSIPTSRFSGIQKDGCYKKANRDNKQYHP